MFQQQARITGSERFDASTTDIAFPAASVFPLTMTTGSCLALIRPVAIGEGTAGYILARVPSLSASGSRFWVGDSAGNPVVGFGAHSTDGKRA